MLSDARLEDSNIEVKPLLPLPAPGAPKGDWAHAFPLSELDRLPSRDADYHFEPWAAVGTISFLIFMFVGSSYFLNRLFFILNCTWATLAVLSTGYILFGAAGEIRRSPETCYPIPAEVANKLRGLDEGANCRDNVKGKEGETYCVRCLVWRPPGSHHCRTCQRCVTGFDHHCSFYGRCIVNRNMPCFYLVAAMLFAAIATSIVALNQNAVDESIQQSPRGLSPLPSPVILP